MFPRTTTDPFGERALDDEDGDSLPPSPPDGFFNFLLALFFLPHRFAERYLRHGLGPYLLSSIVLASLLILGLPLLQRAQTGFFLFNTPLVAALVAAVALGIIQTIPILLGIFRAYDLKLKFAELSSLAIYLLVPVSLALFVIYLGNLAIFGRLSLLFLEYSSEFPGIVEFYTLVVVVVTVATLHLLLLLFSSLYQVSEATSDVALILFVASLFIFTLTTILAAAALDFIVPGLWRGIVETFGGEPHRFFNVPRASAG